MDFDDIKDYAISSIPVVGGMYAGIREGRAVNRHNNRLQEAEQKSARAAAIARAMNGKYHRGPAFAAMDKGVTPPDMTKIGIQKGLANLANHWAEKAANAAGAGGLGA